MGSPEANAVATAATEWESICQVGAEYRDCRGGGEEGAKKCADKLMRETGEPHFVDQISLDDGEGHSFSFYFPVDNSGRDCGNGSEYSCPIESNNENYAQQCVEALNFINSLSGNPKCYTYINTGSVPLFADSYKVILKK